MMALLIMGNGNDPPAHARTFRGKSENHQIANALAKHVYNK